MSETLDYTCILNLHKEGVLAHRAMKSIEAQMKRAAEDGFYGELIVVIDAGDTGTMGVAINMREVMHKASLNVQIKFVDFKDLGMSRNFGVEHAQGDFVFFFDGDDVWGETWVSKGISALVGLPHGCVVHPQLIMNFGSDKLYWHHADSRDPKCDVSSFMVTNHWTAHGGARRELYLTHPYRKVSADEGFGYEDWEWNSRTLGLGIHHIIAPETVHFIRKAAGSMSHIHAAERRVIRPGGLFSSPPLPLPALTPPPKRIIGEWLHDLAVKAHQIEPELWADPRDYNERKFYEPMAVPDCWATYWSLREVILKVQPTHIIFGAGIGGGADTRVVFYAEQIKLAGKVPLVVWTRGKGRIIEGVNAIGGAQVGHDLGQQKFALVLNRNLLELESGTVVHIVNSSAAIDAITLTPKAIKAVGLKVYLSLYAIEKNRDSQLGGYAVNGGLSGVRNVLEGVITDSRSFIPELNERTGWPDFKAFFVPSLAEPKSDEYKDVRRNFLWVGRADWSKNPMMLYRLAKALPAHTFTAVIQPGDEYGRSATGKLMTLPNVTVLPPYTGTLPAELAATHSALLVTSTHEGMPNLVLEALALGLPVVSTRVGAMRELDGSTFVQIVQTEEDAPSWLIATEKLEERRRASRRAHDYLKEEHSQDAVTKSLKEAKYL